MVAFNSLTKLCFTKGMLNLLTGKQHNFVLRDFLLQRSLIFLTVFPLCCVFRDRKHRGQGQEPTFLSTLQNFLKIFILLKVTSFCFN